MHILFPEDPIEPGRVDSSFVSEAAACAAASLTHSLINLELLLAGDAERAVRRTKREAGQALYRGWMMASPAYEVLHTVLLQRNIQLRTTPWQYRLTHEFPGWYSALIGETPRSIWIPAPVALRDVQVALRVFGTSSLIVKDYVKSRKHEWRDACFIQAADDHAEVERVVGNFLERQGLDLQGGLVARQFVDLASVGVHPKSGMPLSEEFRVFVLNGRCLPPLRYWAGTRYGGAPPPMEHFTALAQRIDSPFFTMDVARLRDGSWTVMELGDGQVSGLPEESDAARLYTEISGGTSRR